MVTPSISIASKVLVCIEFGVVVWNLFLDFWILDFVGCSSIFAGHVPSCKNDENTSN